MAGVLVGQNITLKVNGAVSGTATGNNSVVTAYTAPATGYAIVNIRVTAVTTGGEVLVGTRALTGVLAAAPAAGTFYQAYVGPSQTVQASAGAGNAITIAVSGVEFINTP